MSLNTTPQTVTAETYDRLFDEARQLTVPTVDAFETRMGFAIPRERLEDVARVLSCPYKAMAPHWQHGRVIYAATRAYLAQCYPVPLRLLDIGTAKGFSAWSLLRANIDAGAGGLVTSVDVMDPQARVRRNTIAECDGLKTLREIIEPVAPETWQIDFRRSTGIDYLAASQDRIHVAFVDGKHTGDVVRQEGKLLARRQEPGDLAMFDDCQMPGVSVAVASLEQFYRLEYVHAAPRQYAIGRRR